jgi:phosphotransferase system enzyme I (PtsI)
MTIKHQSKRRLFTGVPSSPGYAIGPVLIRAPEVLVVQRRSILPEDSTREIARFMRALDKASLEIEAAKKRLEKYVSQYRSRIFDAHIMIVNDEAITKQVCKLISTACINAEYAYSQRINLILKRFSAIPDPYLKERIIDIKEVSQRVLSHMVSGSASASGEDLDSPMIIFAKDAGSYVLGQLSKKNTLGFILEQGGVTSHISILARSLEIPAISGISPEETGVNDGDMVIVDGNEGILIVNPSAREIAKYEKRKYDSFNLEQQLFSVRDLESCTLDKKPIKILANIELPLEIEKVKQYGADGVGLFRSEFLFMAHDAIPTEEEQYEAFRYIGERLSPKTAVIRTVDSGGDKIVADINLQKENNPFLGWRSIRVCLDQPVMFKTHLRAILRASIHKNIRLLFPMISDISELLQCKQIVGEVIKDLNKKGIPCNKHIKMGCMIEVPSAVFIADQLARESDFLSIGTNDLVQFTLAVDRSNARIANLYEPHHPAVLKMISMVVHAGHVHNKPVCVCGEMAGDPISAILLLGLGVKEFSMRPSSTLEMKKILRSVSYKEAHQASQKALQMPSAVEVNAYFKSMFHKRLNSLHLPPHKPIGRRTGSI